MSSPRPGPRGGPKIPKQERERWRRDPWSRLFPLLVVALLVGIGLMLITGGLAWSNWWRYFVTGLGAVFLIESAVRFYRQGPRVMTVLAGGLVLLVLGLVSFTNAGR